MPGLALKILALSDTGFYPPQEYEEILENSEPDVVALAGDYDEGYPLWPKGMSYLEFLEFGKKWFTLDFFYKFLNFASKRTHVLVVDGNHEVDSEQYDEKRINSIEHCRELSDTDVTIGGLRFAGLGYRTMLSKLKPRVEKLSSSNIDVLVTHCELERLSLLSRLRPKLIIRGHAASGPGKFLSRGIPVVSSGAVKYTSISLEERRIEISQPSSGSGESVSRWFREHPYGWLEPLSESSYTLARSDNA